MEGQQQNTPALHGGQHGCSEAGCEPLPAAGGWPSTASSTQKHWCGSHAKVCLSDLTCGAGGGSHAAYALKVPLQLPVLLAHVPQHLQHMYHALCV
jgi:hypothetical protein